RPRRGRRRRRRIRPAHHRDRPRHREPRVVLDALLLGLRVAPSLALALVVPWFLARQARPRPAATRRVPVTGPARQSLGRHAGIAVVEVAGRALVVGVSDAGIRLLTELDPDAVPAAAEEDAPIAATAGARDGRPAAAITQASSPGAAATSAALDP